MVSNLDGARDRGQEQTGVIIMDFAKAFDKVPHRRLLYKLDCYGIKRIHHWCSVGTGKAQPEVHRYSGNGGPEGWDYRVPLYTNGSILFLTYLIKNKNINLLNTFGAALWFTFGDVL